MMSDVGKRLRVKADRMSKFDDFSYDPLYREAADEIDHLEAALSVEKGLAELRLSEARQFREALDLMNTWVESALNCKEWRWDGDQREAAEQSLAESQSLLSVFEQPNKENKNG